MSYTRQRVMTPNEMGTGYAIRRALIDETPAGLPTYVTDVLSVTLSFLKGNKELLADRASDALGGLLRFIPRAARVRVVSAALDSLIVFIERVLA